MSVTAADRAARNPVIGVSAEIVPPHGRARPTSLSQGRVRLSTGTLYGALHRLLEDRSIERFEQEDRSREKQAYRLTVAGRRQLEMELDRLRQLTRAGMSRLRASEE